MPLHDSIRPPRASAVRIELPPPHDREIVIQPPSLRQGMDCLRLDPKPGAPKETMRERLTRITRQATILFGPEHASLVDLLTVDQCVEIIQALYLAGAGLDPTNFIEAQKRLREQRDTRRTSAELLTQIDSLTLELAAELRQLPSAVEEMPLLDAVNLRDRLAEHAKAAAKWDAALHDKKLS